MAFTPINPKQASYAITIIEFGLWLVLGVTAMLWWLPGTLGEENTIPLKQATFFLVGLWVYALNHWPRLGTKRFFRETPYIRTKITALLFITLGYAYGCVITA